MEVDAILYKHQLKADFPEEVIDEAERFSSKISEKEISERTDLRDTTFFTIDGEKAKDFDDAISIKRVANGYKLFVAIADVSHYIKEGSPLDVEAFTRATSVYFIDRVIPMLPENLSNNICSLMPDVERLTFTAEMEFDAGGDLVDYNFYKSVIKSKHRLTYTNVKKILVDRDKDTSSRYSDILEDLMAMEELALILNNKRRMRGSIDFDLPEASIIIDLRGKPENIIKAERNLAHKMIEEFMLAANETVATHLNWLNIPSIYRVHNEPDHEKLLAFKELAFNLGYHLKVTSRLFPKAFQRLLEEVKDQPEEMLINRVMLRTMRQAQYKLVNTGHFALATSDYTHFTSPIRRYPDLVVHRILSETLTKKAITAKRSAELEATLPKVTDHCSKQERVAEAAEREIIDLKKVQYMVDKVEEEFDGFISGVNSFGFFVELCDIFVEGLVHLSSMDDDYYKYSEKEHMLLGTNLKKVFRIGDMVRVKAIKADVDKRQVDFELVEKLK